MKKTSIAILCAALATLLGASVWEGSAVVAATGELPETGYYVATNSFPRNTVVDVKNLETDKSVRAIVAGPLDSPGLLASLSAEAAEAIGLGRRAVGRVRVTMPADPIAFSRFTEGIAESFDPDRNPKVALAEEAPSAESAPAAPTETVAAEPAMEPETAAEPAETAPEVAVTEAPAEEKIIDVPENYVPPAPVAEASETPEAPAPEAPAEATVLSALPESDSPEVALAEPEPEAAPEETAPEPEAAVAEETPEAVAPAVAEASPAPLPPEPAVEPIAEQPAPIPAPETAPEASVAAVAPEPESAPEAEPAIAEAPETTKAAEAPAEAQAGANLAEAAPVPAAPEPSAPEPETSPLPEAAEPSVAAVEPEAPKVIGPEAPAEAAETVEATPVLPTPPLEGGETVLSLEPAEARPPVAPESDIVIEPTVQPIVEAPKPAPETTVEPEKSLDPALFIAPPAKAETVEAKPEAAPAVLPREAEAAPLPEKPEPVSVARVEPSVAAPVSVESSIIAKLEKGKYYVQLGAFADPAAVNEAVASLSGVFPTAVQEGVAGGKPFYRVFVGPVNQGESGALLLRFKNRGFPDAFVKKGI